MSLDIKIYVLSQIKQKIFSKTQHHLAENLNFLTLRVNLQLMISTAFSANSKTFIVLLILQTLVPNSTLKSVDKSVKILHYCFIVLVSTLESGIDLNCKLNVNIYLYKN